MPPAYARKGTVVLTLRIRFATTNAPESMKRGLLRDRLGRARRLFGFYRRQRIDVAATQEAGTYAEIVDNETPTIKALWAQFNALVKGRQVGNGVIVNARRWKSRLLDDVEVGGLHIAVVMVTHRRTGFAFKFYGLHQPTRRADNSALRPVIDAALREHTRRDDKAGTPWVIAGDTNSGQWGWGVELGDHAVDVIRSSAHFEPLGQTVAHYPLLSDHDFLIADAAVEV